MFGKRPFGCEDGELTLTFAPSLPDYLVGEALRVTAMFLGKTKVCYHLPECRDYFPGSYEVSGIQLVYRSGAKAQVAHGTLRGRMAADVREGLVAAIEVHLS